MPSHHTQQLNSIYTHRLPNTLNDLEVDAISPTLQMGKLRQ